MIHVHRKERHTIGTNVNHRKQYINKQKIRGKIAIVVMFIRDEL